MIKCPFLRRISLQTLKKGHTFSTCPVNYHGSSFFDSSVFWKDNKCPYLNVPLNTIDNLDSLSSLLTKEQVFAYDKFFRKQVDIKKKENSYRIFKKVKRSAPNFPLAKEFTRDQVKGNDIIVWCSNDYLGLSRHPEVTQAAIQALQKHGSGAGGTRNISGNTPYHEKLEETLARWHQKEAGLLFTSCYVANDSTLYTLGQLLPDCVVFSDAGNHASIIHGIKTSGMRKHIYRHNDPEHLNRLMSKLPMHVPKIVVFESVHSMTGSITPMKEICEVAKKHGALTMIDEVHAVGLYGQKGAGIGERDNIIKEVDIISGTLGKALGNVGGYIVGKKDLIDTMRSYASGFIFTTSLPPSVLCGILKALEIAQSDEGRTLRKKQQENVSYLKDALKSRGLPTSSSPSHIIPIHIGDPLICTRVANQLLYEYGMYVQPINYPTVRKGEEMLRIAGTPFHTKEMMDKLVNCLEVVWMENQGLVNKEAKSERTA